MKKLITLSLLSLIGITHASSKSIHIGVSSNINNSKTLLTSTAFKHVNAYANFTIQKAGKGTLAVLDESGNTVLKQQVTLVAGKNKITIYNITNLKEGNYTLCLTTNFKTYSSAFVLWK